MHLLEHIRDLVAIFEIEPNVSHQVVVIAIHQQLKGAPIAYLSLPDQGAIRDFLQIKYSGRA